jgi:tRNA 2-selenouridine synthase SelU
MSNKINFDQFQFLPILGYSGSLKSILMSDLESIGEQVINLEQLIGIDGACLAPLTKDKYLSLPIENLLIQKLKTFDKSKTIYIEWKSPDIIGYPLPLAFTNKIRSSFSVVINEPFDKRVENLLVKYSIWHEHLDLISEKIKSLNNLNFNFPTDRFEVLKNTTDAKKYIQIILSWLDINYQNEIEKFSNIMYGRIFIKNRTAYLLGNN